MDGKTIGAFIVGAVIGVAVGFFVFSGAGVEGERGEWPDIPCPEGASTTAMELLDQITSLAMGVAPPTPDTQACAVMAQQAKMAQPADTTMACRAVERALAAAQSGDWVACKNHLDDVD
jgi:hypothetical protein